MANILVVEDDMDIAQGVAEFLEVKGHTLDFAYTGKEALTLLSENSYQLVLLDINLPFVNGYDVCRSLLDGKFEPSLAKVPVIIMSSRSTEQDILEGFKSGAWDYLTKPFSLAELSARIEIGLLKAPIMQSSSKELQHLDYVLNVEAMTINKGSDTLQLHQVGFDILKLLFEQSPNIVKTSAFHQQLWPDETPESDPLRAHIYKVRKQLSEKFGKPLIETIKGVGYRLKGEE